MDPLHSELRSALNGGDDQPRSAAAEAAFGMVGADLPSFSFDSQPGDVLVFTVSTFHASFGGEDGRRQGVMVYVSAPAHLSRSPKA